MLAGESPLTCEQVRDLDLPDTVIRSTRHVNANPPYCLVFGRIEGNIGFVWTMPDHEAWEGKMLHLGLGGFAGALPEAGIQRADLLRRGYAYGGSNLGHSSFSGDASWAWDETTHKFNEKLQTDFAHHATHITTVITKQITEAYYDETIQYSFYEGCSTGGRQGLMSAQRYPEDFDGIIAGAPALAHARAAFTMIAIQQLLYPDPNDLDNQVLPPQKLKLVEESVLESCDDIDGLEDGIVTDPRACKFTPADDLPKCEPGVDGRDCFTPDQIEVLEVIFGGAKNSTGQLFPGFLPDGTEYDPSSGTALDDWLIQAPSVDGLALEKYPNYSYALASELLRYFVYGDPTYNLQDFDFETSASDILRTSDIIDALNPDLSPFRDRGGRLIVWHGWSDYALPAETTISYYEDVVATIGEDQNVEDFFRLFMLPGVFHCGEGVGPYAVDWLGVLEQWVEEDSAPDRVVATGGIGSAQSRPLCPYPQIAEYDGVGDSRYAEAFSCTLPNRTPILGDSNHDGVFDSSDLVLVLAAGKYEDGIPDNAIFDEGDWNGDGDFESGDLIDALAAGNYEAGQPAVVQWLFWDNDF